MSTVKRIFSIQSKSEKPNRRTKTIKNTVSLRLEIYH